MVSIRNQWDPSSQDLRTLIQTPSSCPLTDRQVRWSWTDQRGSSWFEFWGIRCDVSLGDNFFCHTCLEVSQQGIKSLHNHGVTYKFSTALPGSGVLGLTTVEAHNEIGGYTHIFLWNPLAHEWKFYNRSSCSISSCPESTKAADLFLIIIICFGLHSNVLRGKQEKDKTNFRLNDLSSLTCSHMA